MAGVRVRLGLGLGSANPSPNPSPSPSPNPNPDPNPDQADDAAFQKFNQADIDEILESSSTKISYGQADEASGSVFSKAAFIADENEVNMDDPEFWTKILPEVRSVLARFP